jgi:HTH-type transcriptional regulator/antitoxin HigA
MKLTNEFKPDYASPPGDTIRALIGFKWAGSADDLRVRYDTERELADEMGISYKMMNEIVHGNMAITPVIAEKLERALGSPPARFWLAREYQYRETLKRLAERQQEDDGEDASTAILVLLALSVFLGVVNVILGALP